LGYHKEVISLKIEEIKPNNAKSLHDTHIQKLRGSNRQMALAVAQVERTCV